MSDVRRFTAIIFRENDGFMSLCPELDVASQGESVEEASANLREAVELFIETASASEIDEKLHGEVYVTTLEVTAGTSVEMQQTAQSRERRIRFAALALPSGARTISASKIQKVLDEDGIV
jgi:predicted RNase H-like HicB family nuclease